MHVYNIYLYLLYMQAACIFQKTFGKVVMNGEYAKKKECKLYYVSLVSG